VRQERTRHDRLVARYVLQTHETQFAEAYATVKDDDNQVELIDGIVPAPRVEQTMKGETVSDPCNGFSGWAKHDSTIVLSDGLSGIKHPSEDPAHIDKNSSDLEHQERASRRQSLKLRGRAATMAEIEHGTWLQRTLYQRCRATVEWFMTMEEPPRSGYLAMIVDSACFEAICSCMILANAVLAVFAANHDMEHLGEKQPVFFTSTEAACVTWYTLEILLKISVHGCYFFIGQFWRWNIFDTFLVVLALYDQILSNVANMDPAFMRTMRVLKVAKISRTVRLLRFFSELRLILNSLMGSLHSLFWSLSMLCLIFYIFALVLINNTTAYLEELQDVPQPDDMHIQAVKNLLGSVQQTMLTLYMTATGGDDWNVFYSVIKTTGGFNAAVFIGYTGFIEIAVMNILTGMFVESAMKLAQPDHDSRALEVCRAENAQHRQLMRLCEELDKDDSGTLTKQEFSRNMTNGKLKYFLATLGLDIRDAERFFELLEDTSSEIDIGLFVDACMKLKGNATSIDLQALALKTVQLQRSQNLFEQNLIYRLDELIDLVSTHKLCKESL